MSWGYDLLIDAKRNRWWQWATRFTLERSAAMVGDSEIIRQKAIEHGMPAERIVIFPWGVDVSHFTPGGGDGGIRQRLGWNEDHFVLLSTRSWAPIYGVEELARAFVQAAQRCPQLRLLMLGNGPQAPLIHQIFKQGDVLDRVHFPGQVSEAELPNYYRAVDLYISASHSDGTSISLLEALACGCPVLVSDIPGNREWVENGVQGWRFTEGDVKAMEEKIIHAYKQHQRLARMSSKARRLAEARGDWKINSQQLYRAYEIALDASA
jgi:glycosyltransferase involved in cell wall biosynthesis